MSEFKTNKKEDNIFHLNGKLPGYKKKFEKVSKQLIKEKDVIRASQSDIFKWLIDYKLEG